TIPKREEDWIEQTLKELIGVTENSVVVKKRLEETIASAIEVNLDLVATTKTADEKDIVLNKTISLSIVENDNLKETIADSTDKNTDLEATVNDSVEKESKLKSTIEESIVKNDTLNATINDSISKDVILKATVSDSTDKNTELQETLTSADIKIADINVTADDRLEEINEVADTRIEEIKVSGGAVNKFNDQTFEFWLGTTAQYEAIVEKSRGIMYNYYSEDGALVGGYFKEKPQVVTRGLIEHFDFADGKGTEATLKSRVSDNVLTLSGFNFDENSGWTGKGLKFDGVNDFATSPNAGNAEYMEIVVTPLKIVGNSWNRIVEFGDFRNVLAKVGGDLNDASLYLDNSFKKIITCQMNKANVVSTPFSVGGSNLCFCKHSQFGTDFSNAIIHSIKIYNVALTPEEIAQNYEYEQSIDRTSTQMLPDNSSELSYGIGL
ncbi:MAG: hypothetical protein ACRCZ2_08530, partial [Fusobacteriaceae bacterium]